MIQSENLTQIIDFINRSSSILVILDQSANFDQKIAASSLYLSLMVSGKKVEFLSQKQIKNGTIRGLDKIKTKMGNRNLLISFDYDENSVSKVSYHIDEDNKKFYLTIKPKAGENGLDPQTVGFEKTGIDADLMIFIGVKELEDLDQLYYGYEQDFSDVTKISLSKQAASYADYSAEDVGQISCSEIVANLIAGANLTLDEPVATNLFAGINYETSQFSALTADANTFEIAAMLIRAGAQRQAPSSKVLVGQNKVARQQQKAVKVLEERVKSPRHSDGKSTVNSSKEGVVLKDERKQSKEKNQKKHHRPTRPSGLRV